MAKKKAKHRKVHMVWRIYKKVANRQNQRLGNIIIKASICSQGGGGDCFAIGVAAKCGYQQCLISWPGQWLH